MSRPGTASTLIHQSPASPPTDCEVMSIDKINLNEEFVVQFTLGDKRNPFNFSKRKKWAITIVVSFFTVLVSSSATSFTMGAPSMNKELHSTAFEATLGLSLYCLGFGVFPLLTSAFSEEFGRLPLYYVSASGFVLMHALTALLPNIQLVILSRFIQGAFGSTGATVVAGTLADIWASHERGLPMSVYAALAFAGNGLGALAGGWIEQNPRLGWKWIQWIHIMVGVAYLIIMVLIICETRPAVILSKIAHKLRKTTGDPRYHCPVSENQTNLRDRIYLSCTRPICWFILFYPVALLMSLDRLTLYRTDRILSVWIGFAWGVYYCMVGSLPTVFVTLHGFNQGQIGTVYFSMTVGSALGFITNFYQEKLYRRHVTKRGPEARLYLACVAGVWFSLSMFMFAWSSTPAVPWVILTIALTIFVWSTFTIYLAIFNYLADCYGTYASSALAGQSLFRNIMATIFPMFSEQMFRALGLRWANTLFACLALLMIPIPFVMYYCGHRILAKSRYKSEATHGL